jgi:hypothetical protein
MLPKKKKKTQTEKEEEAQTHRLMRSKISSFFKTPFPFSSPSRYLAESWLVELKKLDIKIK